MKTLNLYKVTLNTNGNISVVYIAVDNFRDIDELAHKAVSYDSVVQGTEMITDNLILSDNNTDF